MKRPILNRAGIALSLFTWIFGAFLLGMGNAYFGVSSEHTDSAETAQHAHQPLAGQGQHDVGNEPRAGSAAHSAHAEPNEPLPAHCLFCLDGLAATGDRYPAVRALFAERSRLTQLAHYTRVFAKNYRYRPATRGPPSAFSSALTTDDLTCP